jgi:hypothetical protein
MGIFCRLKREELKRTRNQGNDAVSNDDDESGKSKGSSRVVIYNREGVQFVMGKAVSSTW